MNRARIIPGTKYRVNRALKLLARIVREVGLRLFLYEGLVGEDDLL